MNKQHIAIALAISLWVSITATAFAEGNISVQRVGGDVTLLGQGGADQSFALVQGKIAGQVVLYRLDETTTFNGLPFFIIEDFSGDMTISLGTGRKLVVLSEGQQNNLLFNGDLNIDSVGFDSVGIIFDRVWVNGTTSISTRHGNDSVVLADCTFGNGLEIDTFQGDDVAYMSDIRVGESLDVATYAGDDYVVLFASMLLGPMSVEAGGGNDNIGIYSTDLTWSVYVNGEGGFDTFELDPNENQLFALQRPSIEDYRYGNQTNGVWLFGEHAQQDIPEFAFTVFVYQLLQLWN